MLPDKLCCVQINQFPSEKKNKKNLHITKKITKFFTKKQSVKKETNIIGATHFSHFLLEKVQVHEKKSQGFLFCCILTNHMPLPLGTTINQDICLMGILLKSQEISFSSLSKENQPTPSSISLLIS